MNTLRSVYTQPPPPNPTSSLYLISVCMLITDKPTNMYIQCAMNILSCVCVGERELIVRVQRPHVPHTQPTTPKYFRGFLTLPHTVPESPFSHWWSLLINSLSPIQPHKRIFIAYCIYMFVGLCVIIMQTDLR